jgi:YhcH/YjgK/YiaL family protein
MISDRLDSSTTEWLARQSDVFKQAFAWLTAMPASQPDGRIDLDEDRIFILVQGYDTLPADQCRWESHRRTIDIQYIFEGGEAIDYQRPGVLTPNNDYDDKREVEFWQPTAPPAATLLMSAGTYVVFLANEPHRPKGSDRVNRAVRKAVFKIDASIIS